MGASESSSSRKIIDGATCLARVKTSAIFFSDSPYHLESRSLPFAVIKLASDSWAIAFARRVFPVPGGPYRSTPLGASTPISLYDSGLLRGHSTASFRSCFTPSRPPTSSQLTLGISISNFPYSRRLDIFQGIFEVFPCDLKRVKDFRWNFRFIKVDFRENPPQRTHCCFPAKCSNVSSYKPMSYLSEVHEIYVF